jgi:preprotein translocase subunit SecG
MNLLINLFLVVFVLVSLLMVFVILMQRPKSEGLGAAFGGAVTENIFGAQTTNVLVKFTTWLASIFFALTFGLSVLYAHRGTGGESAFRRELMKQQSAPTTSPAPATSPAPGTSNASPVSSGKNTGIQQNSPAASAAPASSEEMPKQEETSPAQSPALSPATSPRPAP